MIQASVTNESLWLFQIRRLYLLLTVKESAVDVPTNTEVRRRVTFFSNSLFMDMPRAPRVRKMLSFRCGTYSLIILPRRYIYPCYTIQRLLTAGILCFYFSSEFDSFNYCRITYYLKQ